MGKIDFDVRVCHDKFKRYFHMTWTESYVSDVLPMSSTFSLTETCYHLIVFNNKQVP